MAVSRREKTFWLAWIMTKRDGQFEDDRRPAVRARVSFSMRSQ